jgi:hypothetical protein
MANNFSADSDIPCYQKFQEYVDFNRGACRYLDFPEIQLD